MQVKNYSKILFENKHEYKNLNSFAPVWPFRLLVVGSSGCGKTNTIIDLLLNHIYYNRVYIYAKDPTEDFYECLTNIFEVSKENKILKEFVITSEIDDLIELDNLEEHKNDQTLIIFDDFINESEKEHKPIKTLFTQGRKKNVSTIYISQSFVDIPRIIRRNSNYLLLFKQADDGEAKEIIRRFSGGNKDKIFEMYKEATNAPFNFFLIDKKTNNPLLQYRKNWDELIIRGN